MGRGRILLCAGVFLASLLLLLLPQLDTGGLSARTAALALDARWMTVCEGVDRTMFFPRAASWVPRLEAHWDTQRWGEAAELPPLTVEWRGLLVPSRTGPRTFVADTSGFLTGEVGPAKFEGGGRVTTFLTAGHPYPVRLRLQTPGPQARFILWDRSEGTPLQEGLFPSPAHRDLHSARLAISVVLLWLSGGALAAMLLRSPPDEALRERLYRLAAGTVLLLCLGLRLHERTHVPYFGETADEQYQAWVGHSLWEGDPPTGWSYCPAYESEMVRWFGRRYPVVTPYVDHPPLTPLLATAVGRLAAAPVAYRQVPGGVPLAALRLFPILVSTLALALLLSLGRRWLGAEAALAAGVLYASEPLLVGLHRLVKEESLVALFFLATLWLAARPAGRRELILLGLLCALCPLTKITALCLPAAVLGWAAWDWFRGDRVEARRRAVACVAGTLAGVSLLILYLTALDPTLYARVWSWMADKPSGLEGLRRLVSHSAMVEAGALGPGWNAWIWMVGLPFLAVRLPRVALLAGLYLLLVTLGADQRHLYGCYTIPLRPLLLLGATGALFSRSRLAPPALLLFGVLYLGNSLLLLEPRTNPWLALAVPALLLIFRSERARARLAGAMVLLAAALDYRLCLALSGFY
ncbi:MAG: glycosyltransferase family 39 protein [Armatimonadetes bacterium]|nr:glycosyltransferase family 39 protein [Armatimonadota bacterium]